MPDQNEYFQELTAELEQLQRSLIDLRRQAAKPSQEKRSDSDALDSAHRHLSAAKRLARLLQTGVAGAESRLERAEQEVWSLKVSARMRPPG